MLTRPHSKRHDFRPHYLGYTILMAFFLLTACAAANAQSITVAAAGDIACSPDSDPDYNGGKGTPADCQMKATSDLILERDVDAVLTLGDNQYSQGRLGAFEESYDPTWGRFKDITYPAPGNHDYRTRGAEGYFTYFGDTARSEDGYYSFDLGDWHLVALNSNCDDVGCGEDSAQLEWLKKELAENKSKCTLAYWHHPRFSSGRHGSNGTYNGFWQVLTDAGAELVLSGHDHNYERFAPQTPDGETSVEGVRQFVVGTGGKGLRPLKQERDNSETFVSDFGVLFLTLNEDSYDWSFVSISGETLDSGQASCR